MAFSAGIVTMQHATGSAAHIKLYDYTALSTLLSCEAEWDFRHRQGLTRPHADVSALFGQAVHAGVRALFDGQPREAVADAVSTAWGEFVAPEKKAHLNLAYAQAVVELYGETYGLAPCQSEQRKDAQDAGVAQPFDLVLNERYLEWPERSLCGIVDRVVRSKQDGQLYVMDLKTTGLYLSVAWFEQWRHSLQAAIYLDLVEEEMRKRLPTLLELVKPVPLVAGFWVDAIHLDRRGYPKRDDFMRVGPFPYSPALRAELRERVEDLTETAKWLENKPEKVGKNPRSCFRFGSLCPFFNLCTLDPADRADAVQLALAAGDYEVRRWEPKERAWPPRPRRTSERFNRMLWWPHGWPQN